MKTQLEIVYRSPADLAEYKHNSRTHSDAQIEAIRASFRQFGFTNPILLKDDERTIGAGHARNRAALLEGLDKVPTITLHGLSDAQWRAYVIADNQLAITGSGWDREALARELGALKGLDFDLGVIGFDLGELTDLMEGPGIAPPPAKLGRLSDEFLIPPFSVLNAREGWWQDRKRQWLALGIKSELGRGVAQNDAAPGGSARPSTNYGKDKSRGDGMCRPMSNGKRPAAAFGQDIMKGEHPAGGVEQEATTGTSIFDPVLCEIAYRWFSPKGGLVLDPFAGGSVRGIVAGALGRQYHGVDLRAEQIDANRDQWPAIAATYAESPAPEWHAGDSAEVIPGLPVQADMIFSCPPYGDLEIYSDDPADISNMEAAAFAEAYARIIGAAAAKLKPDRFAVFVVGEYRGARGAYQNIVGQTVAAFEAAGLDYYGEAVLLTAIGSLPIRAAKQFRATRKLGKTHQNILIFVKGDAAKAAKACGAVDVATALKSVAVDEDQAPA